MSGAAPIVRVRRLNVAYERRPALCDITFDVARGRVTALLGPSGCGKTTFLNCLNRLTDLIPGCHVRGEIEIDGRPVHGDAVDLAALRSSVGMIFQKPNPFPLSVRGNLHLPLREHGVRRRRRDEAAERVLHEVGLWEEVADRLDEPAAGLSGGQQQRLCIARALVLRPQILLMDEPCSALDPLATERIEQLIAEMRGTYSIVIVTHNIAQARRVADDALVFWTTTNCGRLIESGPASSVLEHPQHPEAVRYLRSERG